MIETFIFLIDDLETVSDKISKFKKNMDLLDDCIFVDVIEELSDKIDLVKLDELINKKSLSLNETVYVEENIDTINNTIRQHIKNKIQNLNDFIMKL